MSASEPGVGIDKQDDELVVYDVYCIPQPDGTFISQIKASDGREWQSGGYASEADASIAAMQWLQRYVVVCDE